MPIWLKCFSSAARRLRSEVVNTLWRPGNMEVYVSAQCTSRALHRVVKEYTNG